MRRVLQKVTGRPLVYKQNQTDPHPGPVIECLQDFYYFVLRVTEETGVGTLKPCPLCTLSTGNDHFDFWTVERTAKDGGCCLPPGPCPHSQNHYGTYGGPGYHPEEQATIQGSRLPPRPLERGGKGSSLMDFQKHLLCFSTLQ